MIYSWITDPGTITISEIKFWGECVRGCGGGYSNRSCGYYMGSGGMNSVQRRHWGVGPLRHPYSWACIVLCILTADDGISLTRPSRDSFCLTPLSSGFLRNKSLSSDFCSGLILCNLSLLLLHVLGGIRLHASFAKPHPYHSRHPPSPTSYVTITVAPPKTLHSNEKGLVA